MQLHSQQESAERGAYDAKKTIENIEILQQKKVQIIRFSYGINHICW